MQSAANIRIGISGWRYPPWRGTFYPKTLRQDDELHYASRQLNFDEINGTFYSLQRPSNFNAWYDATPADFIFSVKGPRYITHMKRLKEIKKPLANFFASGVLGLGEKLGPMLWQFPPNFKFEPDRMAGFFEMLPRDIKSATKLARSNSEHLKGRTVIASNVNHPIRHAVEIRHYSFKVPEFVTLLRKHNIALVNADTAGKWPVMEDVTTDFIYIRLHGDKKIYVSGYGNAVLDSWAEKIKLWSTGREPADAKRTADPIGGTAKHRDVFVAFDNDVKVRAPIDAIHLADRLGIKAGKARAATFETSGD